MNKTWLVYVGKGPKNAILANYLLGMERNTWGFEKETDDFWNIKSGDTVVFAHHMSWPKAEKGPAPGWFPKFCPNAEDFLCDISEMTITEVTRGAYETATKLWSNKTYPYRFEFDVKEKLNDVQIRPEKSDIKVANAIAISIAGGSKIVPLDSPLKQSKSKGKARTDNSPHDNNDTQGSEEGRLYFTHHKKRERDPKVSKSKKQQVIEDTGDLRCEVCDFSFFETYGVRGKEFAECHHKNPLSDLSDTDTTRTKLDDLAIVCANCHRMIHRYKPWLELDEIKDIFNAPTHR